MARMIAPEGSSPVGLGKPGKDGAYEISEDRIFEMRKVHGFRLVGEPAPMKPAEMAELQALRGKEVVHRDERIAVLQAENQTLQTRVEALTKERDSLAAQLRRRMNDTKGN